MHGVSPCTPEDAIFTIIASVRLHPHRALSVSIRFACQSPVSPVSETSRERLKTESRSCRWSKLEVDLPDESTQLPRLAVSFAITAILPSSDLRQSAPVRFV